jgi:putative SOS response-associated peptidase YedK
MSRPIQRAALIDPVEVIVINRYVGNLPPMPGVFPDYPAPVVRNAGSEHEMVLMRWGMPPRATPRPDGNPPAPGRCPDPVDLWE